MREGTVTSRGEIIISTTTTTTITTIVTIIIITATTIVVVVVVVIVVVVVVVIILVLVVVVSFVVVVVVVVDIQFENPLFSLVHCHLHVLSFFRLDHAETTVCIHVHVQGAFQRLELEFMVEEGDAWRGEERGECGVELVRGG